MTDYCVKCGAPLKKGAVFCTKCGHKKNEDVEEKHDVGQLEAETHVKESRTSDVGEFREIETPGADQGLDKGADQNADSVGAQSADIEGSASASVSASVFESASAEFSKEQSEISKKKKEPLKSDRIMKNPPKFFTASLLKRIIAYLIDIILVILIPLLQRARETGSYLFLSTTPFIQNSVFLLYIYFVIFEWLWKGKTVGKAIMSISTVSTDKFEPPSFIQCVINPFFKATIILLPLEFIIPLFINDESKIGQNQVRILQRLLKLVVLDMNSMLPLRRCGKCGTLQPDGVKIGDTCRKCGHQFTDEGIILV